VALGPIMEYDVYTGVITQTVLHVHTRTLTIVTFYSIKHLSFVINKYCTS